MYIFFMCGRRLIYYNGCYLLLNVGPQYYYKCVLMLLNTSPQARVSELEALLGCAEEDVRQVFSVYLLYWYKRAYTDATRARACRRQLREFACSSAAI